MRSIWAFLRLSRPHFLLGGALLFVIGARTVGIQSPAAYILGQIMVSSAQLTAHYVNEYADIEADRGISNRTLFSGGSGVLSGGLLSPAVALRAARVTSIVAIICAAVIVEISVVATALGLVGLAVAWMYSMPPIRLLDNGYGEVITSVVVTVLVPLIGVLTQAMPVPTNLIWMMAALLPMHMAMMLCFELPDFDNDREAGKTVLAVRFGPLATTRTIRALVAAPILVLGLGLESGALGAEVLGPLAAAASTAVIVVWALRRNSPSMLTTSAVLALVVLGSGLALVS